ncbi:MAG: carbonic anhydrase family protein [bacterium]
MRNLLALLLVVATFASCTNTTTTTENIQDVKSTVLTSAEVTNMSPDSVVSLLKAGNENFITGENRLFDIKSQLVQSAELGQSPMAIVLSCIDSRVPVEEIFNMGLGDLFVARVAGNIVNVDMLGSMEYACEHAGSKVVLVLGHESCGAVNSACAGVEIGNITEMLSKIKPAIDHAKQDGLDPNCQEFPNRVVLYNVQNMITNIRQNSPILAHMEAEGEIKIIGGVFNLHSGVVEFFEY